MGLCEPACVHMSSSRKVLKAAAVPADLTVLTAEEAGDRHRGYAALPRRLGRPSRCWSEADDSASVGESVFPECSPAL